MVVRVASGQGKVREIKVREKSGNFSIGQGNLEFCQKSGKSDLGQGNLAFWEKKKLFTLKFSMHLLDGYGNLLCYYVLLLRRSSLKLCLYICIAYL